mgnify:CR=1 FL=1|jgi:exodeoxyribonuclease-5
MSWSQQQDTAIQAVRAWLRDKSGPQVYYLAGYAGTGKTTIAKELAANVSGAVLFGAFTGKAALVLQRKGCEGASTIHSMIYCVYEDPETGLPKFKLNEDGALRDAALVVIDECSMVGEALGRDLLSFGCRVLVLGDPAQLPPVKDAGYFTERTPDTMLTEVHRQARDNPIIRLSMDVREGRGLSLGTYGSSKVISRRDVNTAEVVAADQVLIGLNRTRHLYNGRLRKLLGYMDPMPLRGERIVCLKNNKQKGLLNGGIWKVLKRGAPHPSNVELDIAPDDAGTTKQIVSVRVNRLFFTGQDSELTLEEKKRSDQFDFGYALTVHKSQGSQWDSVYLFDESGAFREDALKWLYTGITRAADKITIVA